MLTWSSSGVSLHITDNWCSQSFAVNAPNHSIICFEMNPTTISADLSNICQLCSLHRGVASMMMRMIHVVLKLAIQGDPKRL